MIESFSFFASSITFIYKILTRALAVLKLFLLLLYFIVTAEHSHGLIVLNYNFGFMKVGG